MTMGYMDYFPDECGTALWKFETALADGQEITLTDFLSTPDTGKSVASSRILMRDLLKD